MVAWGLIGSGVIVYAITQPTPAWLSRLSGRVRGLVNAQFGSTPTLDPVRRVPPLIARARRRPNGPVWPDRLVKPAVA